MANFTSAVETRSLPIGFELKAVSGRTIEGYAAAWAKDRVGDIIDPRAFNRTIKDNPDVAIFVGHDASKLPVGEPLEMRADGHGLFTRSLIYDTPDGNALLEIAKARLSKGRTLGMSIGFKTVKDRYDSKQKARILEDVDLIEYSFLASPSLAANPQAVALGIKSADGALEPIPDDLEEEVRALLEENESKPYRIVKRDGEFCVIGGASGSRQFGCHATRQGAMAQMRALYANAPKAKEPKAVAQAAEGGPSMSDLEDTAFAWIEEGGTKDEEHKTVPRASRHVPHHDENGDLDLEAVKAFLAAPTDDHALGHIMGHARAAGLLGLPAQQKDDTHALTETAGNFLVASYKALLLADRAMADESAHTHVGLNTHDGKRLHKTTQEQTGVVADLMLQVKQQAEEIDRGEDGAARVQMYRTAFELLDLEEVA